LEAADVTDVINTREVVLDLLMEILENNRHSHLVLRQALEKYQYLDKKDRAFITRLTEGTIENLIQIDYIINAFSKIKVGKMKPVIRNLLRMGVYQIKFMDHIPDSAACNEAVKLAKKRKFDGLKGFVNGILRNVSRNLETIPYPQKEKNLAEYFSVMYSMPEWIVTKWLADYDTVTVENLLKAFLEDADTTVRCNLLRASKEEIIESLKSQNIEVIEDSNLNYVLHIRGYDFLSRVEAFSKGWIQVQDTASCLVGEFANVKPGDYVIDVCSAPGGKALHIAEKLCGLGHVEARDLTAAKVSMISENAARLGITNISIKIQDALVLEPKSIHKADLLVADLPCSGLGVIGRKPDIKYHMTKKQAEELAVLQQRILSTVYQYVKPGGLLIYSTCTIHSPENIENVRWFIKNYPFRMVPIENKSGFYAASMEEGWIQLLPGTHQADGFFLAVMRRQI